MSSFPSHLFQFLQKNNWTIASAESCTGGLLAHDLTNIPGSSDIFTLGLITYSNDTKINILHIPKTFIQKHGAVSEPVAMMMAQNVKQLANSTFGIAVTGIAGPGGGSHEKPVGTVHIAVTGLQQSHHHRYHFEGDRLRIKEQTKSAAWQMLEQFVLR